MINYTRQHKEESSRNSHHLDYFILGCLGESDQPVGSGSLFYLSNEQGQTISAPTIGRRLRDLEQRGLVEKVSVEGRILTPAGRSILEKLKQDRRIEVSAQEFLHLLKRDSRSDIIDQLAARRVIESETSALAASNGSVEIIERLEELIERQRALVAQGKMAVEEDIGFHETIAEASGNKVLAGMAHLLRSQKQLNYVVAAIRAKVHTRFVVDHEEILQAIKARKSTLARQAMEHHLDKLIADVGRYWEQEFPRWPSPRR
ncbi:MAG: FCD domain-containing protein [Acidobacteria bacterium]|nr:FCD domain-containing protein [Acidobacteriota bacterium]